MKHKEKITQIIITYANEKLRVKGNKIYRGLYSLERATILYLIPK